MTSFIDEQRGDYGVEPICAVLPIAPSTYYEQKARGADPTRLPERVQRDAALGKEIERVWHEAPPDLRSAQGVAPAPARGVQGSTLHGGAPDA